MDLLSIVLSMRPARAAPLGGFYGREVQAWLLGQVARQDAALAGSLHAADGMRPYTVSSLVTHHSGRRGEAGLDPDRAVQVRVTSLTKPLSELLLEKVFAAPVQQVRLKGSEFVEARVVDEEGWSAQDSYSGLAARAHNTGGASVTLQFSSPTAFRSDGVDVSLPTPAHVWRSLYQRWNHFAPAELQIDPFWPAFAAEALVVSDFSLHSMKVRFGDGAKGAATGAVGQATYRLLAEKQLGEYAAHRPGADQVLRTLAGFALYSGVGHHTTIGLGQARWLPNPQHYTDWGEV